MVTRTIPTCHPCKDEGYGNAKPPRMACAGKAAEQLHDLYRLGGTGGQGQALEQDKRALAYSHQNWQRAL